MKKNTLLFVLISITTSSFVQSTTLGLINGGSTFFDDVASGWNDKCEQLGITCLVRSTAGFADGCQARLDFAKEFKELGVDGVGYKGCRDDQGPVDLLTDAGIPVVTFDNDYPESDRIAYVGTDNVFLGRTLARLLRQLRPEGGTYVLISYKDERVTAFVEEITRYNGVSGFGHWYGLPGNYENLANDTNYVEDWVDYMDEWAEYNPTAMVIFTQTPMRHANWTQFIERNRPRNITFIGTDGSDYQLDYLSRRFVDGLVGQLPYEMGSFSVQALVDYLTHGRLPNDIIPTNVVSYNLIPLELPPLNQDQNLLGNLVIVGYICFGMIASLALFCAGWTIWNRNNVVVKAAQPLFLTMVAVGILITASSIIPLSFDDGGDPDSISDSYRTGICMSVPWLGFIGFTVAFSALFSKTWRVNRLIHSKVRFSRIQVTERDVMIPFLSLLVGNIVVLLLWTLLDPLQYTREENIGTDYWNRVLSSYGACRSDNALVYLIPLALLNFTAVAIAIWQAHRARNITSVFSEGAYISLSVNSVFQAFLTGIPVIVVVKDMPEAYYLVLTFTIFLLSMAVLLLIFLPKMSLLKEYAGKTEQEQRRMLAQGILESDSRLSMRRSNFIEPDQSSGQFRVDMRNVAPIAGPVLDDQNTSHSTPPTDRKEEHN